MNIIQKIKNFLNPPSPESKFQIIMTEETITGIRDDGHKEEVTWKELSKIEIHTNDLGPFVEDVYWVLHGNERGCVIPQGAPDSGKLLDKLQKLENFNNEKFINSMSCTENNQFIVWERNKEKIEPLDAPDTLVPRAQVI